MKLTLIRHTRLQIAPGICYGQSDIDVASTFIQECEKTKTKLDGMIFDAAYSSPLQRCEKLANALNIGAPIIDHRLKELHFGDWELHAWDAIPRDFFDVWAQNYAHTAPPNGETFSQLQVRGINFLDEILSCHPAGNIAIVTHGGMIRALLAHVLNMPLKGLFRFNIDYGSITQLEFGDVNLGAVPKINFVNL
ncbi:alpha-ribazole phosphatase [Methylotenera versatilis]|uniref:alpha-ribazole phosphatase n=1 Tax=Methylotenera versatilis TaxID=1055487 RepID=UPI000647DEFB|nr:alpha-ribazole phosphatase [Methylotenera versatilis]